MEVVGGILVGLVLTVLLAALGLTTLVAFGIMSLLGLVSEWSFRRIFFTSFLIALLAPIMVGLAISGAVSDENFQRDFGREIGTVFPSSEEWSRDLQEIRPRIEEVQGQLESGEIEREEARVRIEQVIREQTGVELDLEGVTIDAEDGSIRIEND